MPWTKLKNIILLILVLTNLCLLALVGQQFVQNTRIESQTRENAIIFLQERGVEVDEELVPLTMELTPQVTERSLDREAEAAAALLRGGVTAEARGGEVYRYYNENGSIQFHSDGSFSAQLKPDAFPIGEDREVSCRELLEQLDFQGQLLEEDGNELTFVQLWEGIPLFSQQVTVVCQQGGVSALSGGRRLIGTPREDTSRQTITVATALVNFHNGVSALGDVCSRIDDITQGYVTTTSLTGAMTLTPVWRVTTDTGFYQLDAVTGTVSRADQAAGRSADGGA